MKYKYVFFFSLLILLVPVVTFAQVDSTLTKKDSSMVGTADSMMKHVAADTTLKADTAVIATPMNCYKQWIDYFAELGAKPIKDGSHRVVIAFKSKESCHCFMGKVEVAGGKIKTPVYVETEGGDFKTFTALGKKLDADFLAVQGDGLWNISNGMSVVFQTTDNEYGRIFFYQALNKNKQMSKEAPSPSDLLKQ